jgi:uncharacterized protein YaeQ
MALGATLHHIEITVSDVDRGVYQALDLRIAQHPSESMRYLLTRTLAYCLFWEEGIAFSRGLSTSEEPAVWLRSDDGRVRLWIDVGHPSAERLHRASKASDRVVVCSYGDARAFLRAVRGTHIHRAEAIELVAFAPAFLDALESVMARHAAWELVHTGGRLYVTCDGRTVEGGVERAGLADASV